MLLISPKEHKIHYILHFGLQASNKKAEYEVLIVGLRLAKELKVNHLKVYNDSQLVVNQVNETYQARGENGYLFGKGKEVDHINFNIHHRGGAMVKEFSRRCIGSVSFH